MSIALPRYSRRVAALLTAVLPAALSAQAREPFAGLDAYVNAAIKTWNVPGLALAVVRNDTVIYSKGYGVQDVNKRTPVDERTIFAIGSSSKAFTAASIAMLVDEKRVELDAPVTKYLSDFQLADAYATREITVRDLLSHRSGLARGELAWYGSGFDRDEIVRRVRFLQPTWSLRSQFGYQNIMYIAAGQIAARVSGMSWDDFVQQRLLTPLGMTASSTTIRGLEQRTNVASPHAEVDSAVRAIAWRNIDNAGPAGSINSNAVDMAQWVRLQLSGGMIGSKRLISRRSVEEMHTPQTIIRIDSATHVFNPETHFSAYGLGWFLEDYRGREVLHHGGNVDGFTALVAMLPEEKFGLVILTNMNGTGLPAALMHKVFDLQLHAPVRDWSGEEFKRREQSRARAAAAQRRAGVPKKIAGAKPSLSLSEYAGTYVDSLHGEMVVTEQAGALQMTFGPNWRTPLEYWNSENFRVKFETPVLPAFFVQFHVSPASKVNELVADLAGARVTFTRRATAPAVADSSAPKDAPYWASNVTVPTPIALLAGPGKGSREIVAFQLANLANKEASLTAEERAARAQLLKRMR